MYRSPSLTLLRSASVTALFAMTACSLLTDTNPKNVGVSYSVDVLPGFGGDTAAALDINQHGDIVGWGTDANGQRHAALWKNLQLTELATGGTAMATSINDSGIVVGFGQDFGSANTCHKGLIWRDGIGQTLSGPPNWSCEVGFFFPSLPQKINNRGSVLVGEGALLKDGVWSFTPGGTSILAINNASAMVGVVVGELGYYTAYALGVVLHFPESGCTDPHQRSEATLVNDSGVVVGAWCQFLFRSTAEGASELNLTGVSFRALNNQGTLLYQSTGDKSLAMLTLDGVTQHVVLNDPTWSLVVGSAKVNDDRIIVAQAMNVGTGKLVAVRLSPK
jgi:probable HAF family extracellular repeat protein